MSNLFPTIAICIIAVFLCSSNNQKKALQDEAIKRGYAEWAVDAYGKKTLKWKEIINDK